MPNAEIYQSWKSELATLQSLKSEISRIKESLDESRRAFLGNIEQLAEAGMPSEVVTAYRAKYAKTIDLKIGTILVGLNMDERKIDNMIAQIVTLLSQIPINTRGARTYAPPSQRPEKPSIDKFNYRHSSPQTEELHPPSQVPDADNPLDPIIIKKLRDLDNDR